MGNEAVTVDVYVWPTVRHRCQGYETKDVKFLSGKDGSQIRCEVCNRTFVYRRQAPNPQYGFCLGAAELSEPSRR